MDETPFIHLCVTGEEFTVCLLLKIHPFIWSLQAVCLFLAHQVCDVCSRSFTDCGQLIKGANHRCDSPCVSKSACVCLSDTSHPTIPFIFPIFLLPLSKVICPSPPCQLSPFTYLLLSFCFFSPWCLLFCFEVHYSSSGSFMPCLAAL